jgi:hypothetical protein
MARFKPHVEDGTTNSPLVQPPRCATSTCANPAITFTPAVVGYQFTALADIRIGSMGIFDQGGDGLIASADVGIYNLSGELLRRVAIPPSSPLRGDFRYEMLDVPLVVALA